MNKRLFLSYNILIEQLTPSIISLSDLVDVIKSDT